MRMITQQVDHRAQIASNIYILFRLATAAPAQLTTPQVEAIVEFDNNHLVNRIWKVGLSVFRNYAIGMRQEIRAGSDGEPDVCVICVIGEMQCSDVRSRYMFIAACNNSFKLLDMTNDLASKEDSANVDTSQVHRQHYARFYRHST